MTGEQIGVTIIVCTGLLMLIAVLLLCWYVDDKKIDLEKEYLKTLNEHEKAIILDYKHLKPKLFEKRKKNK